MAIGGRRNGRAQAEGDNVDEQNYGVLEEDGLLQLRALDVLNSMNNDINEAVEDGDPALRRACFLGVQLLWERGASLEVKDECGGIPLHDACLGDNKEVVQHLLNASRSPHIVKRMLETVESELGDTPLHHAARADRFEVIRVMLAAGADPKRRTLMGRPQLSCWTKVVRPEGFLMNSIATSPMGSSAISFLILVLEQLASSS